MKPVGTWLTIIGVVLCLGGALAGVMALSELANYQDIKRSGNPFANLVANNYLYFGGIAATALLAGVAIIILGSQQKAAPKAPPAAPPTAPAVQARQGSKWRGLRDVSTMFAGLLWLSVALSLSNSALRTLADAGTIEGVSDFVRGVARLTGWDLPVTAAVAFLALALTVAAVAFHKLLRNERSVPPR